MRAVDTMHMVEAWHSSRPQHVFDERLGSTRVTLPIATDPRLSTMFRGKLDLLQKRQPQRPPRGVVYKLVRQPNRHCIGHGHAALLGGELIAWASNSVSSVSLSSSTDRLQ